MASGIPARALGNICTDRGNASVYLGVHFLVKFVVTTSDSSVSWVNQNSNSFIVLRAFGYMAQAGAAADTAVVNRIHDGTTAAITDTADLSAFADTEQFDFSEINDDYQIIYPQDQLNITTESSPACIICVEGCWLD